jgi:hypothetical protein
MELQPTKTKTAKKVNIARKYGITNTSAIKKITLEL